MYSSPFFLVLNKSSQFSRFIVRNSIVRNSIVRNSIVRTTEQYCTDYGTVLYGTVLYGVRTTEQYCTDYGTVFSKFLKTKKEQINLASRFKNFSLDRNSLN